MDPCRICLAGAPEKLIYQLKSSKKDGEKSFGEILAFCLDIQVTEDCGLTKKLCTKCFKKVLAFYKFKSMALKNAVYLKSLVPAPSIKQEPNENDVLVLLVKQTTHNNVASSKDEMNTDTYSEYEFIEDTSDTSDIPTLEPDHEFPVSIWDLERTSSDNNQDTENSETPSSSQTPVTSESKAKNIPKHSKKTAAVKLQNDWESIKTTNYQEQPLKLPEKKTKIKPSKLQEKITEIQTHSTAGVCDLCGAKVKNMKLHALVHIPKEKRKTFACQECSKVFMTQSALNVHFNKVHSRKFQLTYCSLCNKDFACLKYHIMVMHEPEKMPFQCVVCKKRFPYQSVLDAHMTHHTKERPFQCDHCGKNFRLNTLLLQHVRRVHEKEKNFVCHHCSKTFFKKYHFMNHIRSHTKEKPYKCTICERSYASSTALKQHHQINHSDGTGDVKKFHCKLCTKSFARSSTLYMHKRAHRQERPYKCRHCDAQYARTFDRNRHERRHHGKISVKTEDSAATS